VPHNQALRLLRPLQSTALQASIVAAETAFGPNYKVGVTSRLGRIKSFPAAGECVMALW
jgi:hypothetical protein